MKKCILWATLLILGGCVTIPEGVKPVDHFEVKQYLGQWYEIARLDHSFERGLQEVTAQYSLRSDGGIEVVNRGYDPVKGKWQQAEGKAYPVKNDSVGFFKVSFFGPFYGSYIIFDLDSRYQHALVSGPDKSYLWILSRTRNMNSDTLKVLVNKARAAGFDTEKLIYVSHSR